VFKLSIFLINSYILTNTNYYKQNIGIKIMIVDRPTDLGKLFNPFYTEAM